MTTPSILILNGTDAFRSIDRNLVDRTSLVVCTHPRKRGLFSVLKTRQLPVGWAPERVLGNITRKTLDKLITANL